MNQDLDRLRLDRLALRYLEATARGDLDTVARLWAAAETEPELERLLHELNDELAPAPRPLRRRVWVGLAALGVAACVAALIWTLAAGRGTHSLERDADPRPAPKLVDASPAVPSAGATAPVSRVSRIALLTADLQGADLPAFSWPFADTPEGHAAPTIPADLLD